MSSISTQIPSSQSLFVLAATRPVRRFKGKGLGAEPRSVSISRLLLVSQQRTLLPMTTRAAFTHLTALAFFAFATFLLNGCGRDSPKAKYNEVLKMMDGGAGSPKAFALAFLGTNYHDIKVAGAEKKLLWAVSKDGRQVIAAVMFEEMNGIALTFSVEDQCFYPATGGSARIETARLYNIGGGYTIYVGYPGDSIKADSPFAEAALYRSGPK